jgi:hypothetical protein
MISSRDFDPIKFLSEVHKDTSYKDLEVGLARLSETVEQRTETMKALVKTHFDRYARTRHFIKIKNHLYET